MRLYRLVVLLLLFAAAPARAHESRPLYADIEETSRERIVARLRIPATIDDDNLPGLRLSPGCSTLRRIGADTAPQATILAFEGRCPGGLQGKRVRIAYPVANPNVTTFLKVVTADGLQSVAVLRPEVDHWDIPRKLDAFTAFQTYLRLGMEHIWSGIDHLLFVAGLVLLARTARRIVAAVTGFTLGHSLTLGLAATEMVQLPAPPIEAAIALSIMFLAYELATPDAETLTKSRPLAVASAFGLLHGFGFAAALIESGLQRSQLAVGLLSFNLGVEIGQIAFVVLLLGIGTLAQRAWSRAPRLGDSFWTARMHPQAIMAYGLGIVSSFWFIQRLAALG